MASTWWAASTRALTPFSGSSPACAARPRTTTSKPPRPLAPDLHRSAVGRPAPARAPRRRPRPAPRSAPVTSPSRPPRRPVTSSSTPDRIAPATATAWTAMTMPPFMSKTPGPVARPSATVNGRAASVPAGNTVSWWPTSSTRGSPPPRQWTCGPAALSTSVGRASRGGARSARPTAAADAATRAEVERGRLDLDRAIGRSSSMVGEIRHAGDRSRARSGRRPIETSASMPSAAGRPSTARSRWRAS